jgi:hypothetical protein
LASDIWLSSLAHGRRKIGTFASNAGKWMALGIA